MLILKGLQAKHAQKKKKVKNGVLQNSSHFCSVRAMKSGTCMHMSDSKVDMERGRDKRILFFK